MKERVSPVGLLSRYRPQIMGFAAIWVFLFHEWQELLPNHPLIGAAEKMIVHSGFCGVDIFLFLSGIGLCYSMAKNTAADFYRHRLKRIVIPYLAVAVARGITDGWTVLTFIKNVSGYSFLFENIYSFIWFVPAVLILYLLFPPYYKLMKKSRHTCLFTLGVLVIWLLSTLLLEGVMRYDLYGFTNRIPVFLLGVMLGDLELHDRIPKKSLLILAAIPLLIAGGITLYLTNVRGIYLLVPASNCFLPPLLIALSLPFLIAALLMLIHPVKPVYRVFKVFLGFFGTISFELYCVQEWLGERFAAVSGRMNPVIGNLLLFAAATLIAFLLMRARHFVLREAKKHKTH